MRSRVSLALLIASALAATPAHASQVSVASAVKRDCTARVLTGGGGYVQRQVVSDASGWTQARLRADAGDWDLAVFDRKSGRVVAASASSSASELAEGLVLRGQALTLQACRRSGGDSTASLDFDVRAVRQTREVYLPKLARVSTANRARRQALADLGLDMTGHGGRHWLGVVLHSKKDEDSLRKGGFSWTLLDDNILDTPAARGSLRTRASAASFPSGRDGTASYRTLADYENEMKTLAEKNPDIVRLITLPNKTYEGRTVMGLEISTNVTRNDGKPVFLQLGVHHAREWPSGEHAIEWAYEMVNGYRAGSEHAKRLVEQIRTIVVPVVNVDGFNLSRTAGSAFSSGHEGNETANLAASPGEYQRKNCRYPPPNEDAGGNCTTTAGDGIVQTGVDPNRNYGAFWGGGGATDDPTDQTYYGPGPFSEPETQNIRWLVSLRHVTTLITNHTFSDLVLRPPGIAEQGNAPDEAALNALGTRMSNENGYLNVHGYQLYDTTGTTEDWSYNATGGYGYTFEIGCEDLDYAAGECIDGFFHPAYAKTIAEWEGTTKYADALDSNGNPTRDGGGNRAAYYHAADNAADAGQHSVLQGSADPGATLRLKKTLQLPTSKQDAGGNTIMIEDTLDTAMTVPGSGRYEWHVNPSTSPWYVAAHGSADPGSPSPPQTFSGDVTTAPTPCPTYHELGYMGEACLNHHAFTVPANGGGTFNESAEIRVEWPAESSDWDLEVYRDVNNSGTVDAPDGAPVANSGLGPSDFEQTTLGGDSFQPGQYIVRMINFAAQPGAGDYTGTVTFKRSAYQAARKESWSMSCESPDGRVLERKDVLVDRGQRLDVDICAGAAASCDIAGTAKADTIDGGLGDDCISGKAGDDRLSGGSGKDTVTGDEGVDVVSGGPGQDKLSGGDSRDFITGDSGNDSIDGQGGSNVIDGGAGDDVILGGEKVDSLNGGADEDTIKGRAGNDGITGASGKDRLYGEGGNDRIEGGLGSDVISGGDGGDNIVSIDGQGDSVRCGKGKDVVRADGGDKVSRDCEKVIRRAGKFDKDAGDLKPPTDLAFVGAGGEREQTTGGEARGGDKNDTLDSVFKPGVLIGGAGADLLSGGSADDSLDGGDGIDILEGGPGKDSLVGGGDRDFLEGGGDGDRLDGQLGSNIVNGATGDDVLTGGTAADSLNGGADEDTIKGGDGNDGITGASGRDKLYGEDGNDRMEGGLGIDVISGGDGGDNIVAADGQKDTIRCGKGKDVVRADGEDRIAEDCEMVIVRRGDRFVER